jgi:hypothetical protein
MATETSTQHLHCATCDDSITTRQLARGAGVDEFIARLADDVYAYVHMTDDERKDAALCTAQLRDIMTRIGFLNFNIIRALEEPFRAAKWRTANVILRRLPDAARAELQGMVTKDITGVFQTCMTIPLTEDEVVARVKGVIHALFEFSNGLPAGDGHKNPIALHRAPKEANAPGGPPAK